MCETCNRCSVIGFSQGCAASHLCRSRQCQSLVSNQVSRFHSAAFIKCCTTLIRFHPKSHYSRAKPFLRARNAQLQCTSGNCGQCHILISYEKRWCYTFSLS